MILGITGTNGAGKGAVVEYLKQKGFADYSARNFLVEEVKRRSLSLDRKVISMVANDLRVQHGPAYVIEQLCARAAISGGKAIIESIRVVAEAEFLKGKQAIIVAVDADRKLRYERIVARGSVTDKVNFEKFCEQEDAELRNIDPAKQNIIAVMEMADYRLENSGSVQELHAQIDAMLRAAGTIDSK